MTEAQIQRDIEQFLRLSGFLVYRMNSGKVRNNVRMNEKGTPDLLAVGLHRTLWIEVKTPEGRVSTDQKRMHERLEHRNQEILIARSVEDVEDVIGRRD